LRHARSNARAALSFLTSSNESPASHLDVK
jgi:hypothetical protein